MKALLLILGALVFYLLFRLLGTGRANGEVRRPPRGNVPERMVSCAHCGLHVPASESVTSGGRYYCCEEHRSLDNDDRVA